MTQIALPAPSYFATASLMKRKKFQSEFIFDSPYLARIFAAVASAF